MTDLSGIQHALGDASHRVADLADFAEQLLGGIGQGTRLLRFDTPLGANALRRDLSPEMSSECCRLMRDSIQYALDHREEALNYAMQFARDMETPLAEKFVGMYVNHYTVDCGEIVPKAAQKLLDMGHEAGLIPHRVQLEFIR